MDQIRLKSLALQLIPQSLVLHNGVEYGLARLADALRLVVSADDGSVVLSTFKGDITSTTGEVSARRTLESGKCRRITAPVALAKPLPVGAAYFSRHGRSYRTCHTRACARHPGNRKFDIPHFSATIHPRDGAHRAHTRNR